MCDTATTKMENCLREKEVDHVFLEFADVNGISRSKQLHTDYFLESWQDGFAMNALLLAQTPQSDVPKGTGLGSEIDYGDATVYPEPETFTRLPWRRDTARVLCSFEIGGKPLKAAPRGVLRRLLNERVEPRSLDFTVGSELEFYLLKPTDEEYVPATEHKHECMTWATESVSPFYDRVSGWARDYGIELHSLEHEHGAGQLEVLFNYGNPLEQADTTFDFKRLVKRSARENNQHATFMAKPFSDRAGSGYHLHIGAFQNGTNAFADEKAQQLSEEGRYFVGGLLEHADALAALGTPTLNAFKRYEPNSFAPYTASWGYDNRMAALRIPLGTVRIENRIASADANPYLLIAATLAAGLDGLDKELKPISPAGDVSDTKCSRLPHTPEIALQALERDDLIVDALGKEVVRAYTSAKRQELAAFRESVTDWEREHYIETL